MASPIQSFPRWLYHRTEPARIVQSQEELEALGGDWYASPADIPADGPAPDDSATAAAAAANDAAAAPAPDGDTTDDSAIPTPEDFSDVPADEVPQKKSRSKKG